MTHAHPLVCEVLPELDDGLRVGVEADDGASPRSAGRRIAYHAPRAAAMRSAAASTRAPPGRLLGPSQRNVWLEEMPGDVILDAVDVRIRYVEVLD